MWRTLVQHRARNMSAINDWVHSDHEIVLTRLHVACMNKQLMFPALGIFLSRAEHLSNRTLCC